MREELEGRYKGYFSAPNQDHLLPSLGSFFMTLKHSSHFLLPNVVTDISCTLINLHCISYTCRRDFFFPFLLVQSKAPYSPSRELVPHPSTLI